MTLDITLETVLFDDGCSLRTMDHARLTSSQEGVRRQVEKQLKFWEQRQGVSSGSLVQITDSGYESLCGLTHNSLGMALLALRGMLPSKEQLAEYAKNGRQYVIDAEYIGRYGLTYEALRKDWDNLKETAPILL